MTKQNSILRRVVSILFAVFAVHSVTAQTVDFTTLNRGLYFAKVKLLDEFFERFNGSEVRSDVGEEYQNRESSIMMLYDMSQFNSKEDEGFRQVEKFATDCVRDSVLLHFEDGLWCALARCKGTLQGRTVKFWVILTVEQVDSTLCRWAINDVEDTEGLFLTSRDEPHNELNISPNDNEQFFQSLTRVTAETHQFIDDYVVQGYKADPLSVFLTLVRSGQLRITAVEEVDFQFLQAEGYRFTVKYFNRESRNSGWLIHHIERLSENERLYFIKKLHKQCK